MPKMWELEQFKDKSAVLDEYGETVTYGQLNADANLLAETIGHRCLVFCLCRSEIGSVIGYTAFINNGIVPVMLNSHLEEGLLQNLLNTYSPEYLWLPKDQAGQFASMSIRHEVYNYVLLKTGYEKKYPLYEELGLLMTSSGSTGSPKFIRQSYENLLANTQSIVEYLKLDSSERPITTLPMNYVYGLSIINSHFMVGATILLTEKGLMQKEFTRNEEWFRYIFDNREGKADELCDYDVIIGPIANDTIYDLFGITTSGYLTDEQSLQILSTGPCYR